MLCTWSPPARPGRTPEVVPTTARSSRRVSPARRHLGASRGASRMQFLEPSWQIRRRILAAPLDKEEPRTPFLREVRRTPLLRGWVNSYPSTEGVDLLLAIVGLSASSQRHTNPTDGSND